MTAADVQLKDLRNLKHPNTVFDSDVRVDTCGSSTRIRIQDIIFDINDSDVVDIEYQGSNGYGLKSSTRIGDFIELGLGRYMASLLMLVLVNNITLP